MRFLKHFEEFIKESENNRPVKKDEVTETVSWIEKEIFTKIGLSSVTKDAALGGIPTEETYDQNFSTINMELSADKIARSLGETSQDLLFAFNEKLKSLGYQTELAPGFNRVSISVPVGGFASRGYAKVDFTLV